jgi:metal-responsive CopG/Arc/MetJ family transcriptional regulator
MSDVPVRVRYTVRHTISITEAMNVRLQQILEKQGRDVSMNDLFRTALRQYIDEQEDQIGSKRHFTKSLQAHIEQLQSTLLFYLNLLTFLESSNLAALITVVTGDNKVQSTALIKNAIASALREGPQLNKQIQAVREQLGANK